MKRREFLKIAGVGAVSSLLQSCSAFDIAKPGKVEPNILFILSDDHHPWKVGYRDRRVKTPNIDKIAAQGAHFTRAYSNCPICGPSRTSLMTGTYVHQNEYWSNTSAWKGDLKPFAKLLDQAGLSPTSYGKMGTVGYHQDDGFKYYKTPFHKEAKTLSDGSSMAVSKTWDKIPFDSPFDTRLRGFSWYFQYINTAGTREDGIKRLIKKGKISPGEKIDIDTWVSKALWDDLGTSDHDQAMTDWTVDFLKQKGQNPSKPWTLCVGFKQPHWAYICPEKYFNMYDQENLDLPQDAHWPNENLHPELKHFQTTKWLNPKEEKRFDITK